MGRHATVLRNRCVDAHDHLSVRRSRTWLCYTALCPMQRSNRCVHTRTHDARTLPLPRNTFPYLIPLIITYTAVESRSSILLSRWLRGWRWWSLRGAAARDGGTWGVDAQERAAGHRRCSAARSPQKHCLPAALLHLRPLSPHKVPSGPPKRWKEAAATRGCSKEQ